MLRIIIFILILFISGCYLVQPYYLRLNESKQEKFNLYPSDSTNQFSSDIYSIKSKEFLSTIKEDSANYKLLLFFTNWCPNSEEFLPAFIDDLQDSDCKLTTFFISPDDWVYKNEYINYAKKLQINGHVYLLDVYSYGEKRNPHYRMGKFISEICSDCKDISGFPSMILFNKENKVVFKKVGAVSFDTIQQVMSEDKH